LHRKSIDVVRHCAPSRAIELVGFAQGHADISAVRCDGWNRLGDACFQPPALRSAPALDSCLGGGNGFRRCLGIEPGDAGERQERRFFRYGCGHVTSTSADSYRSQRQTPSPRRLSQRCGCRTNVFDLGARILELPRLPAAFTEVAMIEGERGETALGQRSRVGAARLFLYARERTGEHERRNRFAWRQEQITADAFALGLKLELLSHALLPWIAVPRTLCTHAANAARNAASESCVRASISWPSASNNSAALRRYSCGMGITIAPHAVRA